MSRAFSCSSRLRRLTSVTSMPPNDRRHLYRVSVLTPCFLATAATELRGYVRRLAAELPLPVVLYNIPGRPAPTFDLETLRQAQQLPNVLGLKDSSANMLYFHQVRRLLAERPDWTLLVGPEELLAEAVLLGGCGGVSGGANVTPRLYVDLFEAAEGGGSRGSTSCTGASSRSRAGSTTWGSTRVPPSS